MSCKKFNERLIAVAFGESEIGPDLRAHLAACLACRQEMNLYRIEADGIKEMPQAPSATFSSERLREAIHSREIRPEKPWRTRMAWAGAACAVLLVSWIVAGREIDRGDRAPQPLAMVEPKPVQPLGPITIPEASPDLPKVTHSAKNIMPVAKAHSTKKARTAKRRAPVVRHETGGDELMALATGGASGAVSVSESNLKAPADESAIIVIDPDDNRAMERDSNDVSIGG
jgi:hypothetical protein